MRATLAVIAGFAAWTILWLSSNQIVFRAFRDRFSDNMVTTDGAILSLILVLSAVFSITAGWITARVWGQPKAAPVVTLGILLLAVGVLVQMGFWGVMPTWYHLCFLVLLLPMTLVGGRFGRAEARAHALATGSA